MDKIKELVFGEGLMTPSLEGEKRLTLRRYRPESHDFKKGEIVVGIFKDGLDVLLKITADTLTKPFGKVTDREAKDWGRGDAASLFEGLLDYYPDLKKTDTLAVIEFEVLKVSGVPVVRFNQYANGA